DVSEGQMEFHGCQRPSQSRIRITVDEYCIWLLCLYHLFEMDQHLACLPAVRTGTYPEINVRFRYFHLVKENLRHTIIVMLAGMYQEFCVSCLTQRLAHWRCLNKLWPRTDNGDNFHSLHDPGRTAITDHAHHSDEHCFSLRAHDRPLHATQASRDR